MANVALKALSNGTYQVYIYDATTGRKRYVGVAPTQAAGRTLEAAMRDPQAWPALDTTTAAPWTLASKGEPNCRVCRKPAEHLHHLIPSAELVNYEADPACAGIPVCNACHFGWHHRSVTIHRDRLQPQEIEFVLQTMGRHWLAASYPQRLVRGLSDPYFGPLQLPDSLSVKSDQEPPHASIPRTERPSR